MGVSCEKKAACAPLSKPFSVARNPSLFSNWVINSFSGSRAQAAALGRLSSAPGAFCRPRGNRPLACWLTPLSSSAKGGRESTLLRAPAPFVSAGVSAAFLSNQAFRSWVNLSRSCVLAPFSLYTGKEGSLTGMQSQGFSVS